jgi:hypothetical protein
MLRHTPDLIFLEPTIPLPIPPQMFHSLLKGALNALVAEERALDCPEGLTHKTTAQSGFYTHRDLDGRTSSDRPGALTSDPPPPVAFSRTWMDQRGRHWKMRERFSERLESTYSSPELGFEAYLRYFRDGSA